MQGQPDLLEVILALGPAGRFPGLLDRWQEERNQDRDDRDYDEELNQRKTKSPAHHASPEHGMDQSG